MTLDSKDEALYFKAKGHRTVPDVPHGEGFD